MIATECDREPEVIDAVRSGRWPERCDGELRSHVSECAICTDIVAVAHALQEEHEFARREARIPPAGRIWWRAEMRARQEAARRATQPITVVQGLTGACAAGLIFALVELVWLRFSQSLDVVGRLKQFISDGQIELFSQAAFIPQVGWQLAIALVACCILTPLALYLAFTKQ